jgi:hypothetical protein
MSSGFRYVERDGKRYRVSFSYTWDSPLAVDVFIRSKGHWRSVWYNGKQASPRIHSIIKDAQGQK